MNQKQKDEIMESFVKGETHILVSTTVIEVGVNVPNASVMVVENAERFGLSQLHQLRGRVGRGSRQSYCVLFNQGSGEIAQKRMETMTLSNDGFYISEQDLKLRGPGDFFGIRQSGDMSFMIADIYTDAKVLQHASDEVKRILSEDPGLNAEKHENLRIKMQEIFAKGDVTLSL